MSLLQKTRSLYGRFERPISSASLIFGFIFDAVTLKRLDTLWENIWILAHIIIVGVFISLINLKESKKGDEANPHKAHFWYVNLLQFFFGGILSAFLVFYFRSTDIWSTWPFLFILTIAFIANESLKRHYIRQSFQISLFFLSIYSFMIFLIPILLHKIGPFVFLLSGFLSLVIIITFSIFLFRFKKGEFIESRNLTLFFISGIFILFNILYFTNTIPPIPLSLKEAGIYHSVVRNSNGNYDVTYENHEWIEYLKLYPEFEKEVGAPVYAYSAIFSPRDLNLTIIHEWQYYDEAKSKWITEGLVNLNVIGGRDGGFRTYSMRSDLVAGKWRVNIKTKQGQNIGHLRFRIIPVDIAPELVSDTKE